VAAMATRCNSPPLSTSSGRSRILLSCSCSFRVVSMSRSSTFFSREPALPDAALGSLSTYWGLCTILSCFRFSFCR